MMEMKVIVIISQTDIYKQTNIYSLFKFYFYEKSSKNFMYSILVIYVCVLTHKL